MQPIIRLAELIEDWKYLIRRDGLISAVPQVALEVSRLPYRHLKLMILARSLDESLPDLQPKMTLKIRPFVETDLQLIRQINRPSEARLCAHRLARGHYGFVAMNHVKVAGYAWGCAEIDPQVERVPLKLEHGDVLCNDAFTTPTYRGQGVQTALTIARLQLFQELGYRRALCYIENRNNPSIAVWQRKLNCSIIGQIDFKRIGPWHNVKFSERN
jgi:GNAT superfamily N-acetyltransferase